MNSGLYILLSKKYLAFSGFIFFVMAILNALRSVYGWGIVIGNFVVPMWFSWIGFLIAASLSWAALRLSRAISL